jgi:hypothetical protein
MPQKKFEIFISYRRKGGYDTAKLIYDRLRMDGYSVFFDIDTLEKGDFDNELEQRVHDCKDFLLVLNPGVFDRFFDPECDPKDDWVRQEIKCALEANKNIVPLILDEFAYPKNLPEEVKNITKKNAIDLNPKHFEGAYARMKQKFLLSKPRWATRHKKLIIFSLILAVLLGITAYIYKQKDLQLQAERIATQYADSIKIAMKQADSIRKAELDSVKQYYDSIKNTQPKVQKTNPQIEKPSLSPQKSSGKSIHWSAPGDAIGQAMYEKLALAGIKKTKCEGNGIVAKLNKPSCRTNDLAKIICAYSPKITITDCSGKLIAILEIPENFKTSPQIDESSAKEELSAELRKTNFNAWISAMKRL